MSTQVLWRKGQILQRDSVDSGRGQKRTPWEFFGSCHALACWSRGGLNHGNDSAVLPNVSGYPFSTGTCRRRPGGTL